MIAAGQAISEFGHKSHTERERHRSYHSDQCPLWVISGHCDVQVMSALPPIADIVCDNLRIMKTVTIASVRAHGVKTLLVYCHGKREGDWPANYR